MPKKILKQVTGGWVDESINPAALKILKNLSVDVATTERIGELIGEYRLTNAARETAPTPYESIRHLKQTQALISDLLAKLELMPEDFKALSTVDMLKVTGEVYEQFEARMTTDLMRYRATCARAIEQMKAWPSTKGETPKFLEHKLLSAVAELLEPCSGGLEDAADNASRVLRGAGLKYLPVDKKKARAAILAYKRKSGTPR